MDIIFEWDEAKNKANQRKHKISFEMARLVFEDPCALASQDRYERDEDRWQTIGKMNGIVIALVAHTVRFEVGTEVIRVISARKATLGERIRYEKQAL